MLLWTWIRTWIAGSASSVLIPVLIVLVVLTGGYFSVKAISAKLGFVSTKDKLLIENTEKDNLIKTLKAENKSYKEKLDQCNSLSGLNDLINKRLTKQINDNNNKTQIAITNKDNQINAIIEGPPEPSSIAPPNTKIIFKDVKISPAKQEAISKIQIDSIWSKYNEVNLNK